MVVKIVAQPLFTPMLNLDQGLGEN